MRRTLGVRLAIAASLAIGVVGCSSTPTPTPTPAPAVATPTWDPRRDAIDQAEAIWDRHRPAAYAYTLAHSGPGGDESWSYHVSGVDDREEVQRIAGPALPDDETDRVTVAGLYDAARAGLAGDGFAFEYDRVYGIPTRLAFDGPEGTAAATVDGFSTSADRAAAGRARTALETLLRRFGSRRDATWEYTWSRIPSAGGQADTWTVRHDRKGTTTNQVTQGEGRVSRADVSLDATTVALTNVLAGGGWVDVAIEDEPGFGVLIAVDPSPSAKGDGYWIRVAWTDLARKAAIADVAGAKARWAKAKLAAYSYVWQFEAGDRVLAYAVVRKGDATTVTPRGETPAPDTVDEATPGIEDTFARIEAVLADGGSVTATYDAKLGIPVRVELTPRGDTDTPGVITIKGFKRR